MGLDLLDLSFRLERRFGVKLSRVEFSRLAMRNDPPDIKVGDLFNLLHEQCARSQLLDVELDADVLWIAYQQTIAESLGVDPEEVTEDRGLIHDLGAT